MLYSLYMKAMDPESPNVPFEDWSSKEKIARIVKDCKAMLEEDIAWVNVELGSDWYPRARQSIKLSFADKMASFGKSGCLELELI